MSLARQARMLEATKPVVFAGPRDFAPFADAVVDPIIRQTERDHASLEAVWAQIKATLESHNGQ
jgi:hypothetical protein